VPLDFVQSGVDNELIMSWWINTPAFQFI